jgi:hypothetical protein
VAVRRAPHRCGAATPSSRANARTGPSTSSTVFNRFLPVAERVSAQRCERFGAREHLQVPPPQRPPLSGGRSWRAQVARGPLLERG